MKNRIFKIITFVLVLVVCLAIVDCLLNPSILIRKYYKQQNETIDVLCIGNSAIYVNINPAVLWDSYGIASFNLCESGQMPSETYYYLKEAFKTQSPKLVVYDVYTMASTQEYQDLDVATQNLSGLSYSTNRLDAVNANVESKYMLEAFLGFPVYHKNYTSIINDYEKYYYLDKYGAAEKGYLPQYYWSDYYGEINVAEGYAEIPEKNMEYLIKIYELVKENGAELLLIKCPYICNDYFDKIYNSVGEFAEKNGLNFINFNKLQKELKFDYSNDIMDACHLNETGSKKVSVFLADYINQNYAIPDRRGDVNYKDYDEYSNKFKQTKFKSPEIVDEKIIFNINETMCVSGKKDFNILASYNIDIKEETFYKIELNVSTDSDIYMLVDLYGNGYDSPQQETRFFVESGDNQTIWTIFNTGYVPKNTEILLRMIGDYSNLTYVNSVTVSELKVKNKP